MNPRVNFKSFFRSFVWLVFSALSVLPVSLLEAAPKTSVGLTLLEDSGARPSALGGAFTAMTDDIAGFNFNPASLSSLKTTQASFLYHRGILADNFGEILLGTRGTSLGSFGLSLGYYDAGTEEFSTDGVTTFSGSLQKDFVVSLGYARAVASSRLGLALKYLSSKLGDTASATAFAADLGFQMPVHSKVQLGAALQNLGTSLKYDTESEDLPRIARAGVSFQALPSTVFLLDAIYSLHQQEFSPSFGAETLVGPLALRAGYKTGSDLENLSFGAGFSFLSRYSLDYSFGLVQDLNSSHKISLTMKFGEPK